MEIKGIKHSLPFKDYLNSDGISCSQLKYLAKCPKNFKYYVIDENERIDTEAMKFGRALHTYILQPQLFDKEYYVSEKIRRSGEEWKARQSEAGTREMLWTEDYNKLEQMAKSLKEHPYASKFLSSTVNETSIFWEHKETELLCRSRIDAIKEINGNIALIDLKTTIDASEAVFTRAIFNLKYHVQAAFYLDAYKYVTGKTPKLFIFVAIEKEPPYLCAVHVLGRDSEAIETGRLEYTSLLRKYKSCQSGGVWGEGYDEPYKVCVPNYYKY